VSSTIKFRRGLAVDWAAKNPTLASGELGYEVDTGKYKIGNGIDGWTSRPYFIDSVVIAALIAEAIADSPVGGSSPDASETVKGIVELATLAEMAAGTDPVRVATVAGVRQEYEVLESEIATKANASDLTALTTTVGTKANASDVSSLTSVVNTKAAATDVGTLASLTTTVKTSLVAALNEAIASRLDGVDGVSGSIAVDSLEDVPPGTPAGTPIFLRA